MVIGKNKVVLIDYTVTDPAGNVTQFDYFTSTDSNLGNRGEVANVKDARYGTTGKQSDMAAALGMEVGAR